MNIILDTHAFIWFIEGNSKLSNNSKIEIEKPSNNRYLSVASIWEIAIKKSLNKLKTKFSFSDLEKIIYKNDIDILDIEFNHLQTLLKLNFFHRDPFDRLIISQALSENYKIVTRDINFKEYSVATIW